MGDMERKPAKRKRDKAETARFTLVCSPIVFPIDLHMVDVPIFDSPYFIACRAVQMTRSKLDLNAYLIFRLTISISDLLFCPYHSTALHMTLTKY